MKEEKHFRIRSYVKIVYCIIKLPKVAKQKRTMLHVQIGQSCKTWYQGSQERYIA